MRVVHVTVLALLVGCAQLGAKEDPDDWYDPGVEYNVTEPISFSDQNYAFPADDADGIGALFKRSSSDDGPLPAPRQTPVVAEDDTYGDGATCAYQTSTQLPFEVEGIVTLHPRYYYKSDGCGGGDEKYYGNYFIQDRTGGVFVLGDSKVAHFDVGDKVRMRVRGVKTTFGLDMVMAHDILEVERKASPVFYQQATSSFSYNDCCPSAVCDDQDYGDPRPESCPIGKVWRISGTVIDQADTFGEFNVVYCHEGEFAEELWNDAAGDYVWTCPKNTTKATFTVTLDSELNRRGVGYQPGDRIQVTGPLMYSYGAMAIAIMRVGQITEL